MKFVSSRTGLIAAILVIFSVAGFSGLVDAAGGSNLGDSGVRGHIQRPPEPQRRVDDPQKDESPVLRLGADLVLLDVTVVDSDNKPVMDLAQDNFEILEDRVPQEIRFFNRDQVAVSAVISIDTSGSMRPKLDTVIRACVNLVKKSQVDDELAVIEFKHRPELLEEFTSNINDVADTLQGLTVSGQTAMLDALYLSADYASKEGKNRRKAVIVVTDGLDKDSYYKFDEVVSRLREIDVQIYLIGFTSDLSKDGGWIFKRSERENAERLLNRLAAETGGRAFFPTELADVHRIADQISSDLRTQYAIGYYPTNSTKDGSFRTIKVNVTAGNRRLAARTRAGYTAQRDGAATSSGRRP